MKVERRVLSTSAKSTVSEYTDCSNSPRTETSPAVSSTNNNKSSRKRSCLDDAGEDGQRKKQHSEAHSESDSVTFSIEEQQGCSTTITSPKIGSDSSSVVSYTVSYLLSL